MMNGTIALATALSICALVAGPAFGDHDRHRGRWGQGRHHRGWYGPRHFVYASEPNVYYAPPPVIYTPAYPAPPRIDFIFPLWIR